VELNRVVAAGHAIATLARHYAGTMRDLEGKRIPAAEAIREARAEVSGTHWGRTAEADGIAKENPCKIEVGDTGLEPVTSALSRRIGVVKGWSGMAWRGPRLQAISLDRLSYGYA
jgi:hypothetical protein